ncbi:MAG: hypothetical protein ACE5DW_04315 [Thermodesulfobacteriota bacterium]
MFSDFLPLIIGSIGVILATSSFISGMQLVRTRKRSFEGRIHRLNGYISIALFILLFLISFIGSRFNMIVLLLWLSGFVIILMKLKIVKTRRWAFKYVCWFGVAIISMWIYIIYTHMPLT